MNNKAKKKIIDYMFHEKNIMHNINSDLEYHLSKLS
jgi:hypothetical protein